VPWAIADAAYKLQSRNPGVTEIVKIPNRGHSLTIDHGWREVADTALPSSSGSPDRAAMTMPAADQPVSFAQHIKPLFRERDRESMEFAFDLWDVDDVKSNADAILRRLRDGTMPCDGSLVVRQDRALRPVDRRRQARLTDRATPAGLRLLAEGH
jgi:hypothetical protein